MSCSKWISHVEYQLKRNYIILPDGITCKCLIIFHIPVMWKYFLLIGVSNEINSTHGSKPGYENT